MLVEIMVVILPPDCAAPLLQIAMNHHNLVS